MHACPSVSGPCRRAATTWKGQLALKRQGKEGSLALASHLLPAAAQHLT